MPVDWLYVYVGFVFTNLLLLPKDLKKCNYTLSPTIRKCIQKKPM